MVRLEGFEPPTIRVEAGYSIQLSYSRIYVFITNPLYYPLYERQLFGVPKTIRTPDPLLRTELLYPAELWGQTVH
jgi:hypothetical protein